MVTRYIKDSHLYGVGESVVGQVRPHNEDNCGYAQTPLGHLFIVCDGMGGHAAGEVASKIAVDSVIESICQCSSDINPCDALTSAIQFANMQILGMASADATKKGMGTTICAAIVKDDAFWIAHVGDSRIYLYSKEKKFLYRVSEDHSFVQALVKQGKLDDRDAESHPQKNVILRALGTKETVEVDVEQHPLQLACGDILLMCSDGLSGMIDDCAMQSIIESKENLEDCVEALVSAANTPDKGKDNITCQLIRMENSMAVKSSFPDYTPAWRRKKNVFSPNRANKFVPTKTNRILVWGFLGGISAAIAAICIFFAVRHLVNRKSTEEGGNQDREVVTEMYDADTNIAFDSTEITIEDRPGLFPLKDYLRHSEGKDLSWESRNKLIPVDSLGRLYLSGVSDAGGSATIVVSTPEGVSCRIKVNVKGQIIQQDNSQMSLQILDTPKIDIPPVDTSHQILDTPKIDIPPVDTSLQILDTPKIDIPPVDTSHQILYTPKIDILPVDTSVDAIPDSMYAK